MKKAFTLIELVVVIALTAILSMNLGSKIIAQINNSKVSRVLDTLGSLQTQLSILQAEEGRDIESIEELIFLLDDEYSTLASGSIGASSEIYPVRTNQGGWIYDTNTYALEANLPNGIYTGDIFKEIWGEITGVTVEYSSYKNSNTPIDTGDRNDFINIGRLLRSAKLFAGGGDDTLTIIDSSSSISLRGAEGLFDGEKGNNTLNISNVTVEQWNNRVSSNFKNFTTINLADEVITIL